jgi:uncharacterized membrane protein YdjX (TVP38/TMEM64 family)
MSAMRPVLRLCVGLVAILCLHAFTHSISKQVVCSSSRSRLNLRSSSFGDDFDATKKPRKPPAGEPSTQDGSLASSSDKQATVIPIEQITAEEVSFEYTVPEKIALSLLNPEASDADVWTSRRKITRSFITPTIKKQKEREQELADKIASGEEPLTSEEERQQIQEKRDKATIIITAGMVAAAGVILRLGGRGALISMLGLDFAKDTGIVDGLTNLTNFVSPEHLGSFSYIAFLGLWIVAKVLCIDTATILLALSSGVIFNGVLTGTVISVICGTIASSCNFALARTSLREKTRKIINKKPTLRAIDRACNKEGTGFKTVLTLRLSPLLPIPIAAYSYVYGATSLGVADFLLGTALGSIKPYALDSYLGMLVMGTLTGTDLENGASDTILLAVIGAVLLVGSLATQVATTAWEEMQRELAEEEVASASMVSVLGSSNTAEEGEEEDDLDFIDLVPLPQGVIKWCKRSYKWLVDEQIGTVWSRIEDVMVDEKNAILKEIEAGKGREVPYFGSKEEDTKLYRYPGSRKIRPYELAQLSDENVGIYTFESLLFSFVLFKFILDQGA